MPAVFKQFAMGRLGLGLMLGLLALVVVLAQTPLLRDFSPVKARSTVTPAQTASPAASSSPTVQAGAKPDADQASAASSSSGSSFLPAYQDPQADPAPNGVLTALSLLLKLAIVLALIYGTVWVLRFFGNKSGVPFLSQKSLSVLEATRLAPNRELYVVDLADKVLLLGATPSNISLLTEITDAGAIESLRARSQPALPSAEPFLTYLRAVGDKLNLHGDAPEPTPAIPAALTTPADLLDRIEQSKQRIRERTLAIQQSGGESPGSGEAGK